MLFFVDYRSCRSLHNSSNNVSVVPVKGLITSRPNSASSRPNSVRGVGRQVFSNQYRSKVIAILIRTIQRVVTLLLLMNKKKIHFILLHLCFRTMRYRKYIYKHTCTDIDTSMIYQYSQEYSNTFLNFNLDFQSNGTISYDKLINIIIMNVVAMI